jgi:hypothetical protein
MLAVDIVDIGKSQIMARTHVVEKLNEKYAFM